jgi:hypothetical protein
MALRDGETTTRPRTPREMAADLASSAGGEPTTPLTYQDELAAEYERQRPISAFPNGLHGSGMTLRDWFAGQALAGLAAKLGREVDEPELIYCYDLADALLAAREGR